VEGNCNDFIYIMDEVKEYIYPDRDKDIERLLLIRIFEETLLNLFTKGLLSGTTHTCIGQEYVPVSLMTSVRTGDVVFSNHRGHGHYLARYDDPEGLLAEIMGREGAICHGVGGSQHLYRDNEFISTGVQGESLPLAAGVAWHLKKEGKDSIAMTFIGDGTWGEGIVYETLNLAKLKELPLVVIVENNQISQTTPSSLNMAGTIEGRVKAFEIDYLHITSRDVWECRKLTALAIDKVRAAFNPLVIEFETDRLGSHSKGDDTRSPELIQQIKKNDWFLVLQQKYPEQFDRLLSKVQERIENIVQDVSYRPFSKWSIE